MNSGKPLRLLQELVFFKGHLASWLHAWAVAVDGDEMQYCPYCPAYGWTLDLGKHKDDCVIVRANSLARQGGGDDEICSVMAELLSWEWIGLDDPEHLLLGRPVTCLFCGASGKDAMLKHNISCVLEHTRSCIAEMAKGSK